MLGLIGNLQFSELAIIAIIAVLVFGRRLPQVAGQAAAHVGRARRTLEGLWRETGIEDEVRSVRREIDRFERQLPRKVGPGELARRATDALRKDLDRAGEERPEEAEAASPEPEGTNEPAVTDASHPQGASEANGEPRAVPRGPRVEPLGSPEPPPPASAEELEDAGREKPSETAAGRRPPEP